jgi:hypothetical protein
MPRFKVFLILNGTVGRTSRLERMVHRFQFPIWSRSELCPVIRALLFFLLIVTLRNPHKMVTVLVGQ